MKTVSLNHSKTYVSREGRMLNGIEATPNAGEAIAVGAVVKNTLVKFVTGPDLSNADPLLDNPDETGLSTCGAAERWAGVALNDAADGETVTYQYSGTAHILAGGAITHATEVTSTIAGKLVAGATNSAGTLLMDADALNDVVLVALER